MTSVFLPDGLLYKHRKSSTSCCAKKSLLEQNGLSKDRLTGSKLVS